MTENDYIAEYIKEKDPTLLGLDFVRWKIGRIAFNAGRKIAEAFNDVDWSKLDLPEDESDEEESEDKE